MKAADHSRHIRCRPSPPRSDGNPWQRSRIVRSDMRRQEPHSPHCREQECRARARPRRPRGLRSPLLRRMMGEWVIQRHAECAHPAFRAAARTPNVRSAGSVDGRTGRRRQQWRRGGGDRALRRGRARMSIVERRVLGIAKRRLARSACRREWMLGEGNGRWWEWAARPLLRPLLIPCTHARTRTRTPATRFDAHTDSARRTRR